MLMIVAWFQFHDLCSMVELNDGRKIWTCDGFGVIEYPPAKPGDPETGNFEEWDFAAQDGLHPRDFERSELYRDSVVRPVPMDDPAMLWRLRQLTSRQPYWAAYDKAHPPTRGEELPQGESLFDLCEDQPDKG